MLLKKCQPHLELFLKFIKSEELGPFFLFSLLYKGLQWTLLLYVDTDLVPL